jgi:DNA-binding IclR family transcriptional regulator
VPIGRDRIEDEPEATLEFAEGTQSYTVLRFLAANDEKAFTQTEIHGRTDIPRSSVGVVLSRLENRGLVRHRRRYWAIAEDDRLATLAAQHGASAASTTDDYYGASDG